jgi:site-specific DNA recombinase
MNEAYLYLRVSTQMQKEGGFSLQTQEELGRKYCEEHSLTLKEIFRDEGISGKNISGRPGMTDLLSKLKKDVTVIFPSTSRISRSCEDSLSICRQINEHRAKIVILDSQYDLNDPSGKMMFQITSSFNEYERNVLAKRVSVVMLKMSRDGLLKPKPPYGWRFVNKKEPFQKIEEEQLIITRIKTMNLAGANLLSIAETLNDEKVPCRRAKKWYHQTIKAILSQN